MEQRSKEWFIARLGKFTGSEIAKLMQSGRGKDFGDTAMSYIYQKKAERGLNPLIFVDDDLYNQYIDYTSLTSKAIRFGEEQEDNARIAFEELYNVIVDECGLIAHGEDPTFASSPDGLIFGETPIEIKVPTPAVYMRYRSEVTDGDTLKKVEPKYYYQCQAHMSVTGANKCYFIAYCPFMAVSIHVVEIERNDEDIALILERVNKANNLIND